MKPILTTHKPSSEEAADNPIWVTHDDDSFTSWAFAKAYEAFNILPQSVTSMTLVLTNGLEVRLTRPTEHSTESTEEDDIPYDLENTDICPTHGREDVVGEDTTNKNDPYTVSVLACGCGVTSFGPGEPNHVIFVYIGPDRNTSRPMPRFNTDMENGPSPRDQYR